MQRLPAELADPFVTDEEKGLVLNDRTSQGSSKLVQAERRNVRRTGLGRIVVQVQEGT